MAQSMRRTIQGIVRTVAAGVDYPRILGPMTGGWRNDTVGTFGSAILIAAVLTTLSTAPSRTGAAEWPCMASDRLRFHGAA
jgi:hypothetical protein